MYTYYLLLNCKIDDIQLCKSQEIEPVDKANNYYSADRKLPWFVAKNWQLPVDFIQNDERPITQNEFKENALELSSHQAQLGTLALEEFFKLHARQEKNSGFIYNKQITV